MADEHQDMLKKKIQILFQLGKWPDVLKLCASYGEKYGKDMDVDMIRFKCERHMGISPPAAKAGAPAEPVAPESKGRPQDLSLTETIVSATYVPNHPAEETAARKAIPREKDSYDPGPDVEELDIGNPFAADELVVSDPFTEEVPALNIAPGDPPVVIPDEPSGLEMENESIYRSEPPEAESEPDFVNIGNMTIDAEPELIPAAAPLERASASEPMTEPVVPFMAGGSAEREAADFALPTFDDRDAIKEAREVKRQAAAAQEGPPARRSPLMPAAKEEAAAPKKFFNIKLALLAVLPLLVAALWLLLSGKLDLNSDEPIPAAEPVVARPAPRRPRPVQPAASQASPALAAEQEKLFADQLKLAEELSQKGDLLNARVHLLEAKKIKVTEPLTRLEEILTAKLREAEVAAAAAAQKVAETPKTEWERESEALENARETNTVVGWQDFIRAFPQSESLALAQNRIVLLEKKARVEAERQQQQRIQQAQKFRLRSAYASLSPADIAAVRPGGRPPARYEAHAHGGATVTLDLTAGLMWTLYNKPMAYDKAKWWANRITAGYGGWRLPTAEEALTLLQMDRGLYSGLAGFAVWTGDSVSDQTRSAWVLKIPAGQFVPLEYSQMGYVWAVRNVGK